MAERLRGQSPGHCRLPPSPHRCGRRGTPRPQVGEQSYTRYSYLCSEVGYPQRCSKACSVTALKVGRMTDTDYVWNSSRLVATPLTLANPSLLLRNVYNDDKYTIVAIARLKIGEALEELLRGHLLHSLLFLVGAIAFIVLVVRDRRTKR